MSINFKTAQIGHNRDAYGLLHTQSPRYADWEVTVLFYTALHLIDIALVKNQIDIPKQMNHKIRKRLVKNHLNSAYAD